MAADGEPGSVPLCDDFTIATVIGDEERLRAVRALLEALEDDALFTTTHLAALEGQSTTLSRTEAEAVIVGLLLADAAEKEGRSTPFMDGEFRIFPDQATAVLDEQLVALHAIEAASPNPRPRPDSTLVATVPPGLDIPLPRSVSRLGTRLRSSLLDADEVVRLANPYFDPDQMVIDDLSELPARGIDTRILTRQVIPGTDRFDVLRKMTEQLSPGNRQHLRIRELFHRDVHTGRQAYATHAKMLVVDRRLCYIGSANLTVTSLSRNFELGLVLEGPEVATATAVFDAVFEAATPVKFDGL